MGLTLPDWSTYYPYKAFKWDSCRVAFLVCGDFCGESGLQKLGLCGIHPLTRRYAYRRNRNL
ncbi:hypothetical protein BVJ62_19260 [Vibrio cholerae]|nr:DUF3265 domain-containing protein [Vibrio cholerae]MBO1394331.1 hypothetical protein [Vibrio cholerae]